MATWTDNTKNNSTFTNQPFANNDMTWDEATFTWDAATGMWNRPSIDVYANQSKNVSSFSNVTKN